MTTCHLTESYLDGRLSDKDRVELEAHLHACRACHALVSEWRDIERDVASFEPETDQARAREADAAALVDEMRKRGTVKRHSRRVRLTLAGAFAGGIAIMTLVLFVDRSADTSHEAVPEQDVPVSSLLFTAGSNAPVDFPFTRVIESPDNGRVLTTLGHDRIGLAKGSRLQVLERTAGKTRLRLERGLVACAVAKRTQADFLVEADGYQVRVLGTRFSVGYDKGGTLRVSVVEGRVTVVENQGRTWTLKKGETLEANGKGDGKKGKADDRGMNTIIYLLGTEEPPLPEMNDKPAPSRNSTAASSTDSSADTGSGATTDKGPITGLRVVFEEPPAVAEWQTMIDNGKYIEAAGRINAYLIAHPDDGETWLLLARLRSKVGNWASAVSACQQAIEVGDSAIQSRARFMSATIYQDRLGDSFSAVLQLNKFIQTAEKGTAREEIAKLRLAKGLVVIGHLTTAAAILDQLIEKSPRASIVDQAKALRRRLPSGPKAVPDSH